MSKVRIWKQDPNESVKSFRLAFVATRIKDGPRDSLVEIVGLSDVVRGNKHGDFIFDETEGYEQLDAIHTFTVVRQIMMIYQRALWRIGKEKPLSWQWGPEKPIKININAGIDVGSAYSRSEQGIKFFQAKSNGKILHTNRSYEIVAHEVGHAVLDSLRPGYWGSWQPQTSALHESFADIAAILTTISQLEQCEYLVAQSKANLRDKTFFHNVAEEIIEILYGGNLGFRSADNDLTLRDDVGDDIYDLSRVFTGAFYDILAEIFEDVRNPDLRNDAELLFKLGEHMTSLLVEALLRGPPQNATFKDIADLMISLEKNRKWKSIIRSNFGKRAVLGRYHVKAPKSPVEVSWKKCRCCLSTKEHLKAVEIGTLRKQNCMPCKPTIY